MKLKIFAFSAIALCASMISCNKDVPQDSTRGVESYMALELVGPQSFMTKTLAEKDGSENGTAVENKIGSVKIYLCDASHKIVKTYTVSSGLIETADGAKTLPIKVETGKYQVYVLANPGSVAPSASNITATKIDNITEALMKSTYAADNTFVMFNECNTSGGIDGVPIEITENNDYDHPATCAAIKLDRVAAQVRNTVDKNLDLTEVQTEFEKVSAMNLIGFRLLNGATSFNLQQKWTANTNAAGTFGWKNTLVTPAIAIGSYYNNLSDFRVAEKTDNNDGTFVYTDVKDLYSQIAPYNAKNETSNIYFMENNSTWNGSKIVEALKGNTTGIIYQWQATVPESDKLAGDNCFYGYDGKYFATLEAIEAANPSVFIKATPTGTQTKLQAAQAELKAATTEDLISAFRVKYLIKVYKGGKVYYTYYLKDNNYEQGEGADAGNYYAAIRNTIYSLNVKAIQRIGNDIPGGWNPEADPDDPVDTKDVYMVVEAKVNPWVLSNTDVTLK